MAQIKDEWPITLVAIRPLDVPWIVTEPCEFPT